MLYLREAAGIVLIVLDSVSFGGCTALEQSVLVLFSTRNFPVQPLIPSAAKMSRSRTAAYLV